MTFETIGKNIKYVSFFKKIVGNDISYFLSAENKTSKDYAKCQWETSISEYQLTYFISALESIEAGSFIESNMFKLACNKGKLKVQIKQTECTSKHKTYYFQKSCKRSLSFTIPLNSVSKLLTELHDMINKSDFASNQR